MTDSRFSALAAGAKQLLNCKKKMFSSLRIKNFRLYWLGMFISLIGTWIQSIAQSWLVFKLTNSEFLLGLVGFLNTVPVFLLSLFAGVIVDRMNKKTILLITQNAFMLLAFILAVLIQVKLISVFTIMLLACLNGIVMALDAPARQSVVVELVGKRHLFNAIALNSAAFNSARIIGPALAGILVATVGMSGCFYINGISFFAVIFALLLIKIDSQPRENTHNHFLQDLIAGMRLLKDNRVILMLITMVAVMSLFGVSYVILMPVFAQDVLARGVSGLGYLMSCAGLGALAAALLLARWGDFPQKGRLLIFSTILFSLSLMVFSLSKIFLLSGVALVLVGWSSVTCLSIINTLLQTIVADNFRGRVMSAFMFTFAGVMPFGNLIAGSLAQSLGAAVTVFISAVICLIFFIVINLKYPEIKAL